MKMHDMGEMRETDMAVPSSSGSDKEKYYPTTYISSKKLPGIEKYDVGDECKISSVKKVIGKREKSDGDIEVEVEIREMGIVDKSVEKSDYDKMSDEEKDKEDEKEVLDK